MPESTETNNIAPSAQFVAQVQKLLEHLHDYSFLLNHPFNEKLSARGHTRDNTGQELRRSLLEAIESLSPGPGISFRAPHARVYNVLHLHYVEGMTINEASSELNVSLRQAYRDLRRGEESVAAVLWSRLEEKPQVADGSHIGDARAQALEDEIKRIMPRTELVNMQVLIERALKAVDRLAQGHLISFKMVLPSEITSVVADGAVAQQLLVSIFSHAIQEAQPGQLLLNLNHTGGHVALALQYKAKAAPVTWQDAAITHLAGRLGWQEPRKEDYGPSRHITLEMPIGGVTVLVVDDNASLVELFERYLAGQPCHVVQATGADDGVRLAQELHPDVIILDVMMPEVDGWQVLQTLRTDPHTSTTPVIICSVISDPQLAASLGASGSLSKPVSRDDFLLALRKLGLL
jgi:CheY-like chemotaxis protein